MATYRFAVDPGLGKLIKWLRFLGFDAVPVPVGSGRPCSDRILLIQGARKGVARWPAVLQLRATRTSDQLVEIMKCLGIQAQDLHPLSRCAVCNRMLEPAGVVEVKDRVPEYVARTHQEFTECLTCGRVYWPGTHHDRIRGILERLWSKEQPSR